MVKPAPCPTKTGNRLHNSCGDVLNGLVLQYDDLPAAAPRGQPSVEIVGELPRWNSVIHLTLAESSEFQIHASEVARREGANPVDLDVKYWRSKD